jgi:hypothetical protein
MEKLIPVQITLTVKSRTRLFYMRKYLRMVARRSITSNQIISGLMTAYLPPPPEIFLFSRLRNPVRPRVRRRVTRSDVINRLIFEHVLPPPRAWRLKGGREA